MSTAHGGRQHLPDDWPLWTLLLAAEVVVVSTYLLTGGGVSDARYVVYPFLWINLGLYAVVRVDPPATDGASFADVVRRFVVVGSDLSARELRLVLAAAVAAVYGLVLAVVTGLVGLPLVEHAHTHPDGVQFTLSAPGWGPRLAYVVGEYHLYFVPYRVVGYVALSYLLYAGLARSSLASGAGVVGLASCVGCSFPLLASVVTGAGAASIAAASGYSLDVSTFAFVVAVGVLWWPLAE